MIYLNGTAIPQQPARLNENDESIKTDTFAIDGSMQRNQANSKKRASFTINMATPATFQFIKALYDAAAPVLYLNDASNVVGGVHTFTGIIDFNEDDYFRGGSLMVPLNVTIREQ
jgi:hypothetical protein